MDFDGKTVLITGGGRGIGQTLARDFAARGASIVINYAASAEGANKAVRETDEQLAAIVGETPLATLGNHNHASNLVLYLASSGTDFMTGQTIIPDGGRVMR